jgi:hypothetical protein
MNISFSLPQSRVICESQNIRTCPEERQPFPWRKSELIESILLETSSSSKSIIVAGKWEKGLGL